MIRRWSFCCRLMYLTSAASLTPEPESWAAETSIDQHSGHHTSSSYLSTPALVSTTNTNNCKQKVLKIRIIRHNARISDPGLVLGDADDSVDELDDDDQLSDRLQRSCVRLHRVQVHAAPILQV